MSFSKTTVSPKFAAFTALLLTIPMRAVFAESPGDLNTSFGTSGITTVNIGTMSAEDAPYNAVVDSTGKTIVVGESNDDFAVARFTRNGALDTTFGEDGLVTTDIAGDSDTARAVVIDSSGNIVVVGNSNDSDSTDMAIVRYDSTGNLDTTFGGGDGIVTSDVGGNFESFAYALDIDSSGNIVVAGATGWIGAYDFAVIRLDSSGNLDTTFGGGDGYVTTDIGTLSDEAWAVDTDSSGRVVVAGHTESASGTNYDFALARFDSTGNLDTTFGGGDGIVTTNITGTANDYAYALLIVSTGKIYVGGSSDDRGAADFALVRYTAAGALDTTFDTDGIVTTDVGSDSETIKGLKTSSTKILAVGQTGADTDYNLALVKYSATGALDTTFGGGDGMAITAQLEPDLIQNYVFNGSVGAIAIGTIDGTVNDDFYVASFDLTGAAATTFSSDGVATADFTTGATDAAKAVTRNDQGQLIMAGTTYNGEYYNLALVRLTSAGALDTDFGGGDGIVTLDLGSGTSGTTAEDVALDSTGRILVAGYTDVSGDNDFVLARFTSAGVLDTTFGGGDGYVTTGFASGEADRAYVLAIDSSDRILLGGYADGVTSTHTDMALARYDGDGNLDTTFGGDGKVTLNISDNSNADVIYDLVIDNSGKILAGGTATNSATSVDYALARFDSSGNLDTIFGGGDGYVSHEFSGTSGQDYAYAVTLDSSSNVLMAGTAYDIDGARHAIVVRFDSQGEIDTTFGGGDGYASVDIESTGNAHSVRNVVINDAGKILITGSLDYSTGGYTAMVAMRFDTSGSLDTTFGASGTKYVTSDDIIYSVAYDSLIDDDGRLVLAGSGDDDFMAASLVLSICGDSVVDSGEDCDDGNASDGDGCSSTCATESTFYLDADSDSYGDSNVTTQSSASSVSGYVTNSSDCNDTDSNIKPGATDTCEDGIDQDCNGTDASCAVTATPTPTSETNCTNGSDEDEDGASDCSDSDCDAACSDTDEDGAPDSEDTDDDGDGTSDISDTDDDGDGVADTADPDADSDGDGTGDTEDFAPTDADESTDTDSDGTGDNADTDDDNDGTADDTDTDDDGDGIADTDESSTASTSSSTSTSSGGGGCSIGATQETRNPYALLLTLVFGLGALVLPRFGKE